MLSEEVQTAGPLCSTDIAPCHRSYEPLRHPLPFGRLPGVTGYTAYLAPPISRREEEGFSSCLARPCHRAAATTPPESSSRVSQPTTLDAAFTLTAAGSASGATYFRGHLCVRLRCGPVTCSHPDDGVVDGLQVIGFPPPCHPSYEASGSCLGGTNSRKTRQPLLDARPRVNSLRGVEKAALRLLESVSR